MINVGRTPISAVACAFLIGLSSCITDPDGGTHFDGPTAARVGPNGLLYVGDGYYNARIALFTRTGEPVSTWGSSGYGQGQFHNPHGLAFGPDGTVLVADRDNGRIQRFRPDGSYIDEWKGDGIGRPWDVAVSGDGTVFIVDGGDQDEATARSGVAVLSPGGLVLTRFSSYGSGPGQLNWGHSIAVTEDGATVIVVDMNNARVQKFVRQGSSTGAPSYSLDPSWPNFPAGFRLDPLGVCIGDTLVYVTGQGAGAPLAVIGLSSGIPLREIAGGTFQRAHHVSIDADRSLWVTDVDANAVYHLSPGGDILLRIGGN